jgi:integrase/recombinase XerD
MKSTATLDLMEHQGQELLRIKIPWNPRLIREVKKIPDIRWSPNQRAWLSPYQDALIPYVKELLAMEAFVEDGGLQEKLRQKAESRAYESAHGNAIRQFEDWMISKRYSDNTRKTYVEALKVFLKFHQPKPLSDIGAEDLIRFNKEYILQRGYSASYQNQVVNALKLFFQTIENRMLCIDSLHRPRREHRLPNVLSKEEVKAILSAPTNIKHRAMLSLIYSCGLRRSELLHLKPADIDSKRKLITIRQSKGKKDRIVPLSDKILDILRTYYQEHKPKLWLFEGQHAGQGYDERSLSEVIKQATKKAGIKKPVTLHWLRHSYATHLLESGTDLRYIQELLGHKHSKTTEIYTHVSTKSIQKIKRPFDDL